MENGKRELRSFEDLNAWQQCRRVYFLTYKFTKLFPDDEKFGLVTQMRRAAVSAASNVAEGFGRTAKPDKAHFYTMARGSVTELQNQCILANDVGILEEINYISIKKELILAHKLIVGLIKSTNGVKS